MCLLNSISNADAIFNQTHIYISSGSLTAVNLILLSWNRPPPMSVKSHISKTTSVHELTLENANCLTVLRIMEIHEKTVSISHSSTADN